MKTRLVIAAMVAALSGCAEERTSDDGAAPADSGHVFEVTAHGLKLRGASKVPSGWTRVRLTNRTGMTHFAVIERLPDGHSVKDQQEQIAPVFQQGMDLLNAGKKEEASRKFGELPEWFGKIRFLGGPGFIAPGGVAETMVYLEPGNYMLECYLKTGGVFHSYNPDKRQFGMVHAFTVMPSKAGHPEPRGDIRVSLSSGTGITVEGEPVAGTQIVAVHFADQAVHENFLGHDVHVARLENDTDLDALAAWMDWREPAGLETPAPARFLGGTHEMAAGGTAYFKVQLEPGRYAWIAEVNDPRGKGMLKEFTVR